METFYIIAINGFVSASFSFIAYNQSNKKSRRDYLTTQLSLIETRIDDIRNITYTLHKEIFQENKPLNDNMTYRELLIEINTLSDKIFANNEFKKLHDIMVEYNIFSTNAIESVDNMTSWSILKDFDEIYITFKKNISLLEEKINH